MRHEDGDVGTCMKLDDALLACTVDAAAVDDLGAWCAAAAAGGVDAVELAGGAAVADRIDGALAAGRAADILCFMRDDPALGGRQGSSGVVLSGGDAAIGPARAMLAGDMLAACRVASVDEARLALSVGADFLVADTGSMGVAAVNALRGVSAVPVYAAVDGVEAAADAVSAGVVRLWVKAGETVASRIRDDMAPYARLLGRCI